MSWYILDGNVPRPCTLQELIDGGDLLRVHVRETSIDDVYISTVFLGMNFRYGDGPPLVFETMIFGGLHNQYQERYSTWQEAEQGHERAVELAKEKPGRAPLV